ncbi:MAG: phytanoyl-CoA dioxygenase family protein [Litorimonas sp.]
MSQELLETDGFVILRNVVKRDALRCLGHKILRYFDRYEDLPDFFRKELSPTAGGAVELNRIDKLVPGFYDEVLLQMIEERCAAVLRQDVSFTFANAILKPKQHGAPIRPHQDAAYDGQEAAEQGYTVWLPFTDAHIETGTLFYMPGSHKRGPKTHETSAGVRHVTLPDDAELAPAEIPLGGISLHSALTIHGSFPNLSDEPRLALSLRLQPRT